ncbi:MAG: MCE family protein [Actinobacteria bacterium]|nr:MCE family protein [Actinomycetota bacterium]
MKRLISEVRVSRAARLALLALLAALAVAGVSSAVGAGGDANEYDVRANFVNSSGITIGADVRIGGANVGSTKKIFVNDLNQSSVVLSITDPAFQKFHSNATCRIRLQSLIGEKFVDCDPGSPSKPELQADPTKDGRRLMTVAKTRSPVDLDELLDAMREPQRERFRVIMNELGITLTGRGQDLQDIIRRFDPTFKEINDILKILAKQNDELVKMAVKGDQVMREFSANRKHITGLFREADKTNRAVNVKRAELDQTLARIPAFLDELEPTAREFKRIAKDAAPVARSARLSAKNLSTFVSNTDELVAEANPAFKKFGDTLDVFRAQIPVLQPIATDLNRFGSYRSTITNIRKLLESFDEQGGFMNLTSVAYGITTAANGFDTFGHFVRSGMVILGACMFYSAGPAAVDCSANYSDNRKGSANWPVFPLPASSSSSSASSSQKKSAAGKSSDSSEAAALDYLLGGER